MIKRIIMLLILLISINSISATSEQINETLYIYGGSDVYFIASGAITTNIDKVICINATCTEMLLSIGSNEEYELDYELNYAPNETIYYTKILTVKQEVCDSLLFGLYKKVKRTLSIDAVEVATYNTTIIIKTGTTNTIAFKTLDQSVTFKEHTVDNATLFFTEMICLDQYNLLDDSIGHAGMDFRTIGGAGEDASYQVNKLGGLTGMFVNVLKKIPLVGTSIYNVVYPIMLIIQYVFDFSFTFINLIMSDWWYALLLLECICFIMAITQTGYVNVMQVYVNTHVRIITFIYHMIMIPIINLSITIIVTIRNMFRI